MSYFYIKAKEVKATDGVKMLGTDNSNYVKINVPSGISNTLTLNLPDTIGSSGQFLKLTNVIGNTGDLVFDTVSSGGGTVNADDITAGTSNISLNTTSGNVDINTDNGKMTLSVDNSNSITQKIGTNNIVITDGDNMTVNANIIANNHNLEADGLKLNANSNTITIQSNSSLEATYSLILPSNIGSTNDLLYISNATTGDLAFSNSITETNSDNILSNIQTIAGTVSSGNVQVIENFIASGSYANIINNGTLTPGQYSSNIDVSSFGRNARMYYESSNSGGIAIEVSPDNESNWLYFNNYYTTSANGLNYFSADVYLNSITHIRIFNTDSFNTFQNIYCSIYSN